MTKTVSGWLVIWDDPTWDHSVVWHSLDMARAASSPKAAKVRAIVPVLRLWPPAP